MPVLPRHKQHGNARTTFIILLAALAAGAGFALAAYLARPGFDPAGLIAVKVFPEPRQLDGVELEMPDGRVLPGPDLLQDRWTLMFFGFTHCPDICPTTLLTLADIYKELSPQFPDLQVVFVSVDPERDRGDTLHQYVTHFHPDFIGATGDHAQLDVITRQFGVAYVRNEPEQPGGDYTIGHTAAIVLVDPQLHYYAVLPAPHDAALIADELSGLLSFRTGE